MSKTKNESFLITRPEVRFWLAIIGLVVGGVVAFTQIAVKVKALEKDKEKMVPKIEQVLINQAEMKKDIEYIIKELGI